MARTQQLLTSLRASIIDKPPCISGTLRPPDSCFSLFYKATKDGDNAARYINLANATHDELEQLAQACEPASFGMDQKDVLDESYSKARKMDSEYFTSTLDPVHSDLLKIISSNLLEGTRSTKNIKTELYKLNVYGKGSFFKPHVDTPRSEKMFGSLVIVFPTLHEGGTLLLRHHDQEWTFDSGQALATNREPSIGYVAFFSDIEHEVAPVISGHRVTLTYNLYFDDGPVPGKGMPHLQPENEGAFHEVFKGLLEDPEFLPDGGTLGFGLRHVYPIEKKLKQVHNVLKGSDAVVYQSVRALGYEPMLYLYYRDEYDDEGHEGVIIDKLAKWPREGGDTRDSILLQEGGLSVSDSSPDQSSREDREQVEWVTPVTEFNRQKSAFLYYGNSSSLNWAYGDVCLIVRIGAAEDRLGYTTIEELNAAAKARKDEEEQRYQMMCMKMLGSLEPRLGTEILQGFLRR